MSDTSILPVLTLGLATTLSAMFCCIVFGVLQERERIKAAFRTFWNRHICGPDIWSQDVEDAALEADVRDLVTDAMRGTRCDY